MADIKELDYDELRHWCVFGIPFDHVDQEKHTISLEMKEWLETSCRYQWVLENGLDRIYENNRSQIVLALDVYFENDEDAILYRLFWS